MDTEGAKEIPRERRWNEYTLKEKTMALIGVSETPVTKDHLLDFLGKTEDTLSPEEESELKAVLDDNVLDRENQIKLIQSNIERDIERAQSKPNSNEYISTLRMKLSGVEEEVDRDLSRNMAPRYGMINGSEKLEKMGLNPAEARLAMLKNAYAGLGLD